MKKSLLHSINSDPSIVYNTPDKLDWRGCYRETVKVMKSNGKYKANNADTVMGWYLRFREERTLTFTKIGKNALPPYLHAIR